MSEFCKICGTEKVDGKCPNAENHLKKMCFNCVSCKDGNKDINDSGALFCYNEENLNDAVEKVKANIPSGYSLENISLVPIALKDPTKKCKRWKLNTEIILKEYEGLV